MPHKTKITAVVLAVLFLFPLLPLPVRGEGTEEYQNGDYRYVLNAEGTAVITGYTGKESILNVPGMLDGYLVTGIGDRVFSIFNFEKITSVTLTEGFESIGDRSFYACTNLKTITLPETVVSVGEEAFSHCFSLTDISLPEGITRIEDETFKSCTSLTAVKLPSGLEHIGSEAFRDCTSLTALFLHAGINSISTNAFAFCPNLLLLVEQGSY